MHELYSRCTRAIFSKMARVLADNDETKVLDDTINHKIKLFSLRLVDDDNLITGQNSVIYSPFYNSLPLLSVLNTE